MASVRKPLVGSKSQVVSLRLEQQQVERLRRLARQLGRTPSEAAARLVEEGMRQSEFAYIDFRNSVVGRMAYVQGSGLAVWEVVMVARDYKMKVSQIAEHLHWPVFRVQAALNYSTAFPEEINDLISDNESYDFERISRALPQAELLVLEAHRTYAARGSQRGKKPSQRSTGKPRSTKKGS